MKRTACKTGVNMTERREIENDPCPACRAAGPDTIPGSSLPAAESGDGGSEVEPYRYSPSRYAPLGGYGRAGYPPPEKVSRG